MEESSFLGRSVPTETKLPGLERLIFAERQLFTGIFSDR